MPFKKGEISNPRGKIKGTLNLATRENNARIDRVLSLLDKTLDKDLQELKGEERIKTWLALTEYRNPKLARQIITEQDEKQIMRIIFAEIDATVKSTGNGSLQKESEEQSENGS